jgi:carbamoyltransferase
VGAGHPSLGGRRFHNVHAPHPAASHDPAACLVADGRVIAAAVDERFTHIKHGKRPIPFSTYKLPYHAIDYCLREAGIRLVDVDHVAYSFDP